MRPRIPKITTNINDWVGRCGDAVNSILARLDQSDVTPFTMSVAPPLSPVESQTYYDLTLHKLRYWNGSAWVDL